MSISNDFGPFTAGGGEVEVRLGLQENQDWHEITVRILDDTGQPATTGVTGTLAGSALKRGSDRREAFVSTLNLANDERAWDPELSRVGSFFFEDTGLNANYVYWITVNSWRGA